MKDVEWVGGRSVNGRHCIVRDMFYVRVLI